LNGDWDPKFGFYRNFTGSLQLERESIKISRLIVSEIVEKYNAKGISGH